MIGEPANDAAAGARGVAVVASAEAVLDALPRGSELLNSHERARARRLRRGTDRTAFVAAHVLLRLCGSAVYGAPLDLEVRQVCDVCGGPHGRPQLPSLPGSGASLSHAGEAVAAVVAPGPVGIDVELTSAAQTAAQLALDLIHPAERRRLEVADDPDLALLLLWVRKEALAKAGRARIDAMSAIDLSALPIEPPAEHRRRRWRKLWLTDITHQAPPALAAVVAPGELDLVPVEAVIRS